MIKKIVEAALRAETLVMSADVLLKWKAQILDYQQRVTETKPVQQATLFDLAPNATQTGSIRCSWNLANPQRSVIASPQLASNVLENK
ncbi:hypothetical protein IQ277_11755 [Nostocales cyanobacterium LEGE 12452]|nr:hypothetical protein [Nostocales cyanobacterium LEGE 12452]